MATRQFDTKVVPEAERASVGRTPVAENTRPESVADRLPLHADRGVSVPPPHIQATALTQASGDHLARVGAVLLRLQGRHGNRYVQQVVDHARQAVSPAAPVIQAKLVLGPADDCYEREADRIAQQVMCRPDQGALDAELGNGGRPAIQRLHGGLHGAAGGAVDAPVAQAVQQARTGGRAVPGTVRARMERALGADFSGVKIHVDARADRLNDALRSRAFTIGADVFVRRSDYRPGSQRGDALLAHELTHTVQQGAVTAPSQEAVPTRFADQRPKATGRGGVIVQRAWVESESDSVVQWDQLRGGLRWYFDTRTRLMHYTVEDEYAILSKHKKAYFDTQGKAFTYEQWISAGWVSDEQAPTAAGPEKVADGKQKETKEYSGPTSGIEVENPVPFALELKRIEDRGVIAAVETDSGDILAEFTTDMGSNPYTIENRTTPVVEDDIEGVSARKKALSLLDRAISEAGQVPDGSPIAPRVGEGMKIVIRQGAHKVVPTKSKKAAKPGIQITKGVSLPAMLADAPSLKGVFAEAEGRWMQEYAGYAEKFKTDHPDAEPNVVAVFGMLASLLHFYMLRIDAAMKKRAILEGIKWDEVGEVGVGGKGVVGNEVSRPDLVDPSEKNAWGLLPKTPPLEWLSGLSSADVALVKGELRKIPSKGVVNEKAWRAILGDIMVGKMIAGHAVPKFKIGGATGLAFEIRLPKAEERQRYGYSSTTASKQGTSTTSRTSNTTTADATLTLPPPGTTVTRELVRKLTADRRLDLLKILHESSEYPLEKFETSAMRDVQMALGYY